MSFQQTVVMNSKGTSIPLFRWLTIRIVGRRLSEIKGALIFVEKWELNVIPSPKSNTLKAVVKIDFLRLFGDEGEATIGDPREFNSYRDVKDALTDPRRKAYPPLLTLVD